MKIPLLVTRLCVVLFAWLSIVMTHQAAASESKSLQQLFEEADPAVVASEARLRGNPEDGALVYYKSAAACVACHEDENGSSPLGPDLARLGNDVTDVHLVEALLHPSQSIRKGYETVQLVTYDGEIVSGMLVREDDETIVLRDAANLQSEISIDKEEIDVRSNASTSMMPEGLMATFSSQRDVLDLLSYLFAIHEGGPDRAEQLKPAPELLITKDDTANLDHEKIIRQVESGRQGRGKMIYDASCVHCHGSDGNTPSLATARAFGREPLKFGADPHSMFRTLSHGNGLMAAVTTLSPRERYEVVGYIRHHFMKGSNPDYQPVTDEYLASLPKGTEMGEFKPDPDRDYGPALASQLGREVNSALTIALKNQTISYDLHTMDQASVWSGGFLDLDQTQHKRGRGEGLPKPKGRLIDELSIWKWGHDGSLEYPTEDLLPRGPLPNQWFDYHGHYLHGDQVVLSYAIDGREILETPSSLQDENAIRHTLKIGGGKTLVLAVGSSDSENQPPMISGDIDGVIIKSDAQRRRVIRIPADQQTRLIDIVRFAFPSNTGTLQPLTPIDPATMTQGGKLRWPETFKTVGYRGLETGAYAVDTITMPKETPWNTWFRTSALDFYPDGRMVVATVGGDVWIVSGIDDDLLSLEWKRFAGGLYEPFGIKVVDGLVYVTCKDRLTRLHDFNGDGEADFYESFSADTDVSTFFHAFNFDLQVDSKGNLYYAKSGQYTDYKLPGAVIKVSPDGKTREVVCTGFRTPNGMGILPNDRITVSDNQGTWMPASKISFVKPGGFYGYSQTQRSAAWAPDGGKIDHTKVIPPETFDQPVIWMPQEVDNSSGGQVFVDDERFGPLSGRLLHTSFGKGWLFYLMPQEVTTKDGDVITQAAIVKCPHDFGTGIMRGNVNPQDGQVYVTGLDGWNENGRAGLADGGIYRVRYTGKPMRMITQCEVHPSTLHLTFNFPLDPQSASDVRSYVAEQWNYQWTRSYGSPSFHPETGEEGKQQLVIQKAVLSEDRKTLTLHSEGIRPVHQLHLKLDVTDAQGIPFSEEVYWTIHAIPTE
ncbi:DUF6797 domain-containing protein [Aporhodopirellula aestuarii]|uniref:C-type cytochrome n=1 Tax=Aporhodopirellula aestuarii TaxID=2950107 RepID=A0ABT0U5W8_9BACT|nr:DUF6797 domain-containing protein [Aporhodopirellula aestuarii]MCM2372054.1 c-type cytochrome [Aporhodopirellula aestuarii]